MSNGKEPIDKLANDVVAKDAAKGTRRPGKAQPTAVSALPRWWPAVAVLAVMLLILIGFLLVKAATRAPTGPESNRTSTPASGGTIDPCLVGTWRSVLITGSHGFAGWQGILVTITPSGAMTADYSQSAPAIGKSLRETWRGVTTDQITASGGVVHTIHHLTSNTSRTYMRPDGTTISTTHDDWGEGGFLPPAPKTYTCTPTSLNWVNFGFVTVVDERMPAVPATTSKP